MLPIKLRGFKATSKSTLFIRILPRPIHTTFFSHIILQIPRSLLSTVHSLTNFMLLTTLTSLRSTQEALCKVQCGLITHSQKWLLCPQSNYHTVMVNAPYKICCIISSSGFVLIRSAYTYTGSFYLVLVISIDFSTIIPFYLRPGLCAVSQVMLPRSMLYLHICRYLYT